MAMGVMWPILVKVIIFIMMTRELEEKVGDVRFSIRLARLVEENVRGFRPWLSGGHRPCNCSDLGSGLDPLCGSTAGLAVENGGSRQVSENRNRTKTVWSVFIV